MPVSFRYERVREEDIAARVEDTRRDEARRLVDVPLQRSVLFLRHVMGMSGHEVASILDTNRAAVFATAARAERRLRDLLNDESAAGRAL